MPKSIFRGSKEIRALISNHKHWIAQQILEKSAFSAEQAHDPSGNQFQELPIPDFKTVFAQEVEMTVSGSNNSFNWAKADSYEESAEDMRFGAKIQTSQIIRLKE